MKSNTKRVVHGLFLNCSYEGRDGRDEGQAEMRTFPMYASNPSRTVCVEVELEVGKGKCIADGVLESV